MGYVALLLGLLLAVMTFAWMNRRSTEVEQLKAERARLEELLEECVLVRGDLESMLSELNRQSEELVKKLERQAQMERRSRTENAQSVAVEKIPTITPAKAAPLVIPERYRGVSQMLDKGFEAKEIAEDLQIGVGEIQLLLNLKNRVIREKTPVN
ncbi:MAG: hypothetical protein HPY50_14745 [Firmicutes bacterium]|nr:hypothetical protein [Bacillota bacterium]